MQHSWMWNLTNLFFLCLKGQILRKYMILDWFYSELSVCDILNNWQLHLKQAKGLVNCSISVPLLRTVHMNPIFEAPIHKCNVNLHFWIRRYVYNVIWKSLLIGQINEKMTNIKNIYIEFKEPQKWGSYELFSITEHW